MFIDDTGSRHPDHAPANIRFDGMDCFGLGGILLNEEDTDALIAKYKAFRERWNIDYPLHSYEIRGGRGSFGWLRKPENAAEFLPDLQQMLLSLPAIGIAAVIHRPGFATQYREFHGNAIWTMPKAAYSALIERAAKFARSQGRRLRVFFEGSGPAEDRDILGHARELKAVGTPFDPHRPASDDALSAEDFRDLVLGEPKRKSKATPMIQIADLMLYPMAKAGYDPSYKPYRRLMEHEKIIDALLPPELRTTQGCKYSCFPDLM